MGRDRSARAGAYQRQPTGYRAFIPAPLPPDPPVQLTGRLQNLLSLADRALGRLDGAIQSSPGVRCPPSRRSANSLVAHLTELGILHEITGYARNRRFRYEPYVRLFTEEGP